MSTNVKNIIRDEFLKNFTTKIKRRCIIVESAKILNSNLQSTLKSINHDINKIIQLLNIKTVTRQIPYITLVAQFDTKLDSRSRIVLRGSNDFDEKVEMQSHLIGTNVSHCIDFIIAEGYKDIKISPIDYDAEIIVSNDFMRCAIVDIMLDIAMFNSYSFLKDMSTAEKHDFSYKKYSYFDKNKLDSFYECKTNKKLYYSLAFSARKGINDFDIDEYVKIWDDFIKINYHKTHAERPVFLQLKQHVDFDELPQGLAERFSTLPEGSYLILRTNKDRSIELKPFICSEFGIEKYEKGKIKIVPIEEFNKYKPMLEKLDVSAFKIVNNNSTALEQNETNRNHTNNEQMSKYKSSRRFKIALSFPGEHRNLVSKIASGLSSIYGKKAILYDKYHSSEFARPNLDTHLQTLYSKESDLVVVFNCADYNTKTWCGIEWRAIRQLINNKDGDERVMLIKCGPGSAEGIFDTIDGYIDDSDYTSIDELIELIIDRYERLNIE